LTPPPAFSLSKIGKRYGSMRRPAAIARILASRP